MNRIGTISFQANDNTDVFLVMEVREDGIETSDETMMNIPDAQFDSDKAWVTGKVPKIKPVQVEGDTGVIQAWFKGEAFGRPIVITVYLECEMTEELLAVEAEEKEEGFDNKDDLEPQEIHL